MEHFNTVLNYIGTWTIGSFTAIDLLAATTNAFNGAILINRRDHLKKWTLVGILLVAVIGGIGGGVSRDVLLNDLPAAFTNPWYLILCTLAGILALVIIKDRPHAEVRRIFDFMSAFSLPWYAIIGAQKALAADLPLLAVLLIGIVGPTAGRYFIDLTCGVTPHQFTRGEWFVGAAVLSASAYIFFDWLGLSVWPATLLAWSIGFTFRALSRHYKWEEPELWPEEQNLEKQADAPAT